MPASHGTINANFEDNFFEQFPPSPDTYINQLITTDFIFALQYTFEEIESITNSTYRTRTVSGAVCCTCQKESNVQLPTQATVIECLGREEGGGGRGKVNLTLLLLAKHTDTWPVNNSASERRMGIRPSEQLCIRGMGEHQA